jgi:hypothetical protein
MTEGGEETQDPPPHHTRSRGLLGPVDRLVQDLDLERLLELPPPHQEKKTETCRREERWSDSKKAYNNNTSRRTARPIPDTREIGS